MKESVPLDAGVGRLGQAYVCLRIDSIVIACWPLDMKRMPVSYSLLLSR